MSIFKEAERLAKEWNNRLLPTHETLAVGAKMSDLLRAIAAMDVEVKPDATAIVDFMGRPPCEREGSVKFSVAVPCAGSPLYTQQSLDAAILRAAAAIGSKL